MAAVPSFRLGFVDSKLTGRGALSTCVRRTERSLVVIARAQDRLRYQGELLPLDWNRSPISTGLAIGLQVTRTQVFAVHGRRLLPRQ